MLLIDTPVSIFCLFPAGSPHILAGTSLSKRRSWNQELWTLHMGRNTARESNRVREWVFDFVHGSCKNEYDLTQKLKTTLTKKWRWYNLQMKTTSFKTHTYKIMQANAPYFCPVLHNISIPPDRLAMIGVKTWINWGHSFLNDSFYKLWIFVCLMDSNIPHWSE